MDSIKEMYNNLSTQSKYPLHASSAVIGAAMFSFSGTRC